MIDKVESTDKTNNSINEKLWRGEIEVREFVSYFDHIPPDAKVRIYGNKLQIMSPADNKVYTLDKII